MSSLYPSPVSLEPFAIRAEPSGGSITACLWTKDEDIGSLSTWASRWKGSSSYHITSLTNKLYASDAISLLVVTRHERFSPEAKTMLSKLRDIHKISSVKSKVSVHILYLPTHSQENPNAFLNLARIFSQTRSLVLFPGSLSVVPPKMFYRSIASVASSPRAVVFSARQRTAFPFAALSPIVLKREDPLWCTERFFPLLSRAADWSECLWQVWLENFGDVEIKSTTDWVQNSRQPSNISVAEVRMH